MGKLINLIGNTYNLFTVKSFHGRNIHGAVTWVCQCTCGRTKIISSGHLKYATKYCKCVPRKEVPLKYKDKLETGTKEYRAWSSIKWRCYNSKSIGYHNYGGRGIKVCDRWIHSYESFLEDVGRAPSPKHSIDRKDNDGNYEPGNVRWATRKQQGYNRRPTIDVYGQSLSEYCVSNNLPYSRTIGRISKGWSIEDAIRIPKLK